MISWEIKKLIKSKAMLISLVILSFILVITIFNKPILETENNYSDQQQGYIEDNRPKLEIANEKFRTKISILEEVSNQENSDELSNVIKSMSKEKIDNLNNNQYEDVGFWQVFNYRATNPLINVGMLVIIMIIISNLYTDEIISSVKDIILSSKEKKKALNSKIIISFLIPIVVYILYLAGAFIITYLQQGVPMNGNLEAFRIVNNIAVLRGNPTIIHYILINIGIAILMFEGWAMVSMLVSFISTSSIASISMFGVFIVLTKVISTIKIIPAMITYVFSYSNYYDLIFNFNNIIGSYIGSINTFGYSMNLINLVVAILMAVFIASTVLCLWVSRTKYVNR